MHIVAAAFSLGIQFFQNTLCIPSCSVFDTGNILPTAYLSPIIQPLGHQLPSLPLRSPLFLMAPLHRSPAPPSVKGQLPPSRAGFFSPLLAKPICHRNSCQPLSAGPSRLTWIRRSTLYVQTSRMQRTLTPLTKYCFFALRGNIGLMWNSFMICSHALYNIKDRNLGCAGYLTYIYFGFSWSWERKNLSLSVICGLEYIQISSCFFHLTVH